MNNPNTTTPAISTTDANGVQWIYDPAASKWTAIVDGKKYYSKDFDTVREKVLLHSSVKNDGQGATKKTVEPMATVVEVGMLALKSSSTGSGVDLLKDTIKVEPIMAKIEWDATKGEINIIRYKETAQKDSGWKSWRSGELVLVHPQFLTQDMRRVLEKSFEGRLLREEFLKAEKEIAQTWWNGKTEECVTWRMTRTGYEKQANPAMDRLSSSNTTLLSDAWPTYVPENAEEMSFADWKQQNDGSLKRGEIVVRMEKSTGSFAGQNFDFNVYMPSHEQPVYGNRDLRVALFMGNATQDMLENGAKEPIETWQGSTNWSDKPDHHSWPTKLAVRGAAVIPERDPNRSNYRPSSYFFGQRIEDAVDKKTSSRHDDERNTIGWHTAVRSSYYGASYRAAGPDDAALTHIQALHDDFRHLAQDRNLQPMDSAGFAAVFKETLANLYNAVVDGEEIDKDPTAAKNAFDNILRSMSQKASSKDSTMAWAKRCADTVAAAKADLSNPPSPPAAKGPKRR